ncbi:MAG: hypothetical protein [Wendovervirus sonii]|uniref:Uncharacterized protein n=1 Tax=phage Lak_Megaphage_Sonny TaxID=3109229 RepID=A0ABZ0Z277_9CAUD|nr:MAG: hypothetical protein [phage Lak_Megaphage_Sonny]
MLTKKKKENTEIQLSDKAIFIRGFQELAIQSHLCYYEYAGDGLTLLRFKDGSELTLKTMMNSIGKNTRWE